MARKERTKERVIRGRRPWRVEGDRLKAFRKALFPGLSFSQYAEDVTLNAHAYRQNENGKTRISVEAALLLKSRYGLPLDWIYDGDQATLTFQQTKEIDAWLANYKGKK